MGSVECNKLVVGLMREAFVVQARVALGRLRRSDTHLAPKLARSLGQLLNDMGKLEEARPLPEEAL